jgi:hypothetical protein
MPDDEDFRSPFPSYDVLAKWPTPSWNEQTRRVVAQRIENPPERRYFTAGEWDTAAAIASRIIPQADRGDTPVPIVPLIDQRLDENRGKGYRYEDMPSDREAWRLGIAAIDDESRIRFGKRFIDARPHEQDATLRSVQTGEVASALWRDLPPKRFFTNVLVDDIVGIYYAHPAAWNEIGFGGPASPRGYVRIGLDQRDAWEAEEEA